MRETRNEPIEITTEVRVTICDNCRKEYREPGDQPYYDLMQGWYRVGKGRELYDYCSRSCLERGVLTIGELVIQ